MSGVSLMLPGDPRRQRLDELQAEIRSLEAELTAVQKADLPLDEVRARAHTALEAFMRQQPVDYWLGFLRRPGGMRPLVSDEPPTDVDAQVRVRQLSGQLAALAARITALEGRTR